MSKIANLKKKAADLLEASEPGLLDAVAIRSAINNTDAEGAALHTPLQA